MHSSRRHFLRATAGGVILTATSGRAASPLKDKPAWPVAAFEKNFQKLSYDDLGRRMARLGFQGIEATVRPGGHIEPERAVDELPAAVESLQRHGVSIMVMASGINEVNPLNEKILRAAAGLGIARYRMAYWKYAKREPVRRQLEEFRARAKDLAAANRDLGIQAIYQNHAGSSHLGAPLWDLHAVLEDIEPAEIGIGLDLRHSRIEGGTSWKISYSLVRPHVQAIYVKDARWQESRTENVPLGQGLVTEEVFREATRGIGPLPLVLHVEYHGHKPLDPAELPPVVEAHRRDLAVLKSWIRS